MQTLIDQLIAIDVLLEPDPTMIEIRHRASFGAV
jgi:hypothetical protein